MDLELFVLGEPNI